MMAKIETTAFDSADYLNTAEAIAAYLDAYLSCGKAIRSMRFNVFAESWSRRWGGGRPAELLETERRHSGFFS